MFFINGTSKELKVGPQALDREQQDQYTLVVELLKNGKNKGFALVRNFLVENYASLCSLSLWHLGTVSSLAWYAFLSPFWPQPIDKIAKCVKLFWLGQIRLKFDKIVKSMKVHSD